MYYVITSKFFSYTTVTSLFMLRNYKPTMNTTQLNPDQRIYIQMSLYLIYCKHLVTSSNCFLNFCNTCFNWQTMFSIFNLASLNHQCPWCSGYPEKFFDKSGEKCCLYPWRKKWTQIKCDIVLFVTKEICSIKNFVFSCYNRQFCIKLQWNCLQN